MPNRNINPIDPGTGKPVRGRPRKDSERGKALDSARTALRILITDSPRPTQDADGEWRLGNVALTPYALADYRKTMMRAVKLLLAVEGITR